MRIQLNQLYLTLILMLKRPLLHQSSCCIKTAGTIYHSANKHIYFQNITYIYFRISAICNLYWDIFILLRAKQGLSQILSRNFLLSACGQKALILEHPLSLDHTRIDAKTASAQNPWQSSRLRPSTERGPCFSSPQFDKSERTRSHCRHYFLTALPHPHPQNLSPPSIFSPIPPSPFLLPSAPFFSFIATENISIPSVRISHHSIRSIKFPPIFHSPRSSPHFAPFSPLTNILPNVLPKVLNSPSRPFH